MTTTPASSPAPALDRLFNTLRRSPVTRSSNRVVAGVCSGIAERLGISTAIVRVGAVVLAIIGPALVIYLAAWLLLPDPNGRIRLERAVRDGDLPSIALLVGTLLAFLPDAGIHPHMAWFPFLAIGVIAVVGHRAGWWRNGSAHRGSWGSAPTSTPQPGAPSGQGESPQDAPQS